MDQIYSKLQLFVDYKKAQTMCLSAGDDGAVVVAPLSRLNRRGSNPWWENQEAIILCNKPKRITEQNTNVLDSDASQLKFCVRLFDLLS